MMNEPFDFAGFTWPRYIVSLPRGTLTERLEQSKKPKHVGKPYHAPPPITKQRPNKGRGFYLEDRRTMPGLRWAWCTEMPRDWFMDSKWVWTSHGEPQLVRLDPPTLGHNGWFAGEDSPEIIHGLVFKLPKQRGYLAGWSMGERMASEVDATIHDNARDAAMVADSMAQNAAEREQEYQMQQQEEDLRWEEFEQWFDDNEQIIASDLLSNAPNSRLNELPEEIMDELQLEFIQETARRCDEINDRHHPAMILWAEYKGDKTTLRRGEFFDWLFNNACEFIRRKKEHIHDELESSY